MRIYAKTRYRVMLPWYHTKSTTAKASSSRIPFSTCPSNLRMLEWPRLEEIFFGVSPKFVFKSVYKAIHKYQLSANPNEDSKNKNKNETTPKLVIIFFLLEAPKFTHQVCNSGEATACQWHRSRETPQDAAEYNPARKY